MEETRLVFKKGELFQVINNRLVALSRREMSELILQLMVYLTDQEEEIKKQKTTEEAIQEIIDYLNSLQDKPSIQISTVEKVIDEYIELVEDFADPFKSILIKVMEDIKKEIINS